MPVIVKDTMFGSGSEVEVAGETLTKAAVPTFCSKAKPGCKPRFSPRAR